MYLARAFRLFAYCSVLCNTPGMSSSITARNVQARSVTTSIGSPYARSAVVKNRGAGCVSRRAATSTSMILPYWSIARET
jgi:hypothetical protein